MQIFLSSTQSYRDFMPSLGPALRQAGWEVEYYPAAASPVVWKTALAKSEYVVLGLMGEELGPEVSGPAQEAARLGRPLLIVKGDAAKLGPGLPYRAWLNALSIEGPQLSKLLQKALQVMQQAAQTPPSPAAAPADSQSFVLNWAWEGLQDQGVFSLGQELLIGRNQDCQIVLPFANASRHHAKLWAGPAGLQVQNLSQKNKVYLQAQAGAPERELGENESAPLLPGMRFRVSQAWFELLPPPAAPKRWNCPLCGKYYPADLQHCPEDGMPLGDHRLYQISAGSRSFRFAWRETPPAFLQEAGPTAPAGMGGASGTTRFDAMDHSTMVPKPKPAPASLEGPTALGQRPAAPSAAATFTLWEEEVVIYEDEDEGHLLSDEATFIQERGPRDPDQTPPALLAQPPAPSAGPPANQPGTAPLVPTQANRPSTAPLNPPTQANRPGTAPLAPPTQVKRPGATPIEFKAATSPLPSTQSRPSGTGILGQTPAAAPLNDSLDWVDSGIFTPASLGLSLKTSPEPELRAFFAPTAAPEQSYRVLIALHQPEVLSRLRQELEQQTMALGHQTRPLVLDKRYTLHLQVEGLQFDRAYQTLDWQASDQALWASFLAQVPPGLQGDRPARIMVYLGGLLRWQIPFSVRYVSSPAAPQWSEAAAQALRVFACYAESDAELGAYLDGALALANQAQLNDLHQIRRAGRWSWDSIRPMIESAEAFQLFWDEHTARSTHCQREWAYALKLAADKPRRFVYPVYWADNLQVPPPPELLHLSFQRLTLNPAPR